MHHACNVTAAAVAASAAVVLVVVAVAVVVADAAVSQRAGESVMLNETSPSSGATTMGLFLTRADRGAKRGLHIFHQSRSKSLGPATRSHALAHDQHWVFPGRAYL